MKLNKRLVPLILLAETVSHTVSNFLFYSEQWRKFAIQYQSGTSFTPFEIKTLPLETPFNIFSALS